MGFNEASFWEAACSATLRVTHDRAKDPWANMCAGPKVQAMVLSSSNTSQNKLIEQASVKRRRASILVNFNNYAIYVDTLKFAKQS